MRKLASPRRSLAVGVSIGALVVGAGTAVGQPTVAWLLQPSSSTYASANSLSADGSMVVGTLTGPPTGLYQEAFRWTAAGGMQLLGVLPGGIPIGGHWSVATAVSGDGSTVVGYSLIPDPSPIQGFHGFVWTAAGGMQDLGNNQIAYGVNADGTVVVGQGTPQGPPFVPQQPFRWTAAGGMQYLGTTLDNATARGVSADGDVIVGTGWSWSNPGGPSRAFRWTAVGGIQPLGTIGVGPGAYSEATAVSADGSTIVGNWGDHGTHVRAFRWTAAGGMQDLGMLVAGENARAYGVSADGSAVVGMIGSPGPWWRAFLWTSQSGMISLNEHLSGHGALLPGGPGLGGATGISADKSVIIGNDHAWGWIITGLSPVCYPDCNFDGSLTVADFGCFQTKFVASPSWADYCDCNDDGVVSVADFGCFQTKFVQGCP